MLVRVAIQAMGTRFELVLPGADEPRLRAIGEECLREIELWHTRLNAFAADSDIARINRAEGTPVRIDRELFDLLTMCEAVRKDSGGLFDITCGRAMERAGFRETQPAPPSTHSETDRPPTPPLTLDLPSLTVTLAAGLQLDLGGVAKGFALDRAAGVLRQFGVSSALIHGGTSGVAAIGSPPDEPGWRVAIASDGSHETVVLRNECLAVTAPRGRVAGTSGHIIDPRTGAAVAMKSGNADTAAIVGPSAALCDAWAKPLLLLGERPGGLPAPYQTLVHLPGGWCKSGPDRVQHAGSGDIVGIQDKHRSGGRGAVRPGESAAEVA